MPMALTIGIRRPFYDQVGCVYYMPCYFPLQAFYTVRSDGKKDIVFSSSRAELFARGLLVSDASSLQLPCGKCIGCRLEYSRQWAVRIMHEASLYDDNCFLTLTYSDDYLPSNNSLDKEVYPSFMKRLRSRFSGIKLRYFHVGEYGETTGRPHYHACLFNFDFADKSLFSVRDDVRLYHSPLLDEIWGLGFCTIGSLTFDSAAYVARYCLKKVTGVEAVLHYGDRIPEFCTMSRRPGIGRGWYDKYKSDVFPSDFLVVNGVKCKPPRFYDNMLEEDDLSFIKSSRVEKAVLRLDDSTSRRLNIREKCKQAQISNLKRSI